MSGARVDPSQLAVLQRKQNNIRNICILAHVDHGKTTLSDHLVCSNGLISPKLAGKLRFLDSTEEEQRRGITIHSSAITLLFKLEDKTKKTSSDGSPIYEDYLVNLIDCPGHIDFSSDVSTATRLCDGAIILVDVLEGVCTQTRAVLHKALKERMRPCLVLNKIDRLCLEMKLSSVEAFQQLRKILENVNALSAQLVSSELKLLSEAGLVTSSLEEELMQDWIFRPERGNVVFCSALDSWGFGVAKFASHWAPKLEVARETLVKYMFEDCTFLQTSKKIVKCVGDHANAKPLFASLILDPIFAIYQTAIIELNPEKASKMAKRALEIELQPREINTKDPRATAQAIFRRWLPLSDALLRMVVRCVPGPVEAQGKRISTLYPAINEAAPDEVRVVRGSIENCQSGLSSDQLEDVVEPNSAELVLFVSKMMPVRVAELTKADVLMLKNKLSEQISAAVDDADSSDDSGLRRKLDDLSNGDGEVMMALTRVFSGDLSSSRDLYVIGNRYDPCYPQDGAGDTLDSLTRIPAGSYSLYLCFGPSVFPIDRVPAGNIVGIVGIDSWLSKTATLSSSKFCYPMRSMTFQAIPMVRVAVEAVHHSDMKRLELGLKTLYQYDPAVEIEAEENGQLTIACLGELHLEQCMKSLTERFCKCELRASEPLVQFKETLIPCEKTYQRGYSLPPPWGSIDGVASVVGGRRRFISCAGHLAMTVRCTPMPEDAVAVIEKYPKIAELGKSLQDRSWSENPFETSYKDTDFLGLLAESFSSYDVLMNNIDDDIESRGDAFYRRLLSLDGKVSCSNILLFSPVVALAFSSADELSSASNTKETDCSINFNRKSMATVSCNKAFAKLWSRVHHAVVAGFCSTAAAGPLMMEALYGVSFMVEKIEIAKSAVSMFGLDHADLTAFGVPASELFNFIPSTTSTTSSGGGSNLHLGQLISDVSTALRVSLLASSVRIVEPVYMCELQCDQSQIGNLYAVLSKRRGVVSNEDIIDGTSLFLISAHLPVSESFGFAQELLEKTSGNAISPQLTFSHWQILDVDPFWRPTTTQELEDHGAQATDHNLARIFIDKVRRRKGLTVEEKVVASAEKQRNLSKNK